LQVFIWLNLNLDEKRMSYRVAINGYGRIGQSVLRVLCSAPLRERFTVVAINELSAIDTIAYLTRYDTTHGRFPLAVDHDDDNLLIDGVPVKILCHENPEELPWAELGVDLVFECSGSFRDRKIADIHLQQGAKRLLISHPGCHEVDSTIVFGVNDDLLRGDHEVVSNASCTTNCILPVLDLLEKNYVIDSGVITTVHSAMNDQPVIDSYHKTNLRLTRSALHSIVPVDTSLAKGIERLFPRFKNRFECLHLRVPTINVSLMDLSVNLKRDVSKEEVNNLFKTAASGKLEGLLGYTHEPHASVDFNTDSRSCIVDGTQTRVCNGRLLKMVCWFDNEWGFANRMVDVAKRWLSLKGK